MKASSIEATLEDQKMTTGSGERLQTRILSAVIILACVVGLMLLMNLVWVAFDFLRLIPPEFSLPNNWVYFLVSKFLRFGIDGLFLVYIPVEIFLVGCIVGLRPFKNPQRFTGIIFAGLLCLILLMILAICLLRFLELFPRLWIIFAIPLLALILVNLLLAGCIASLPLSRGFASVAARIVGTAVLAAVMASVSSFGLIFCVFGLGINSEYVVERDGVKRIVLISSWLHSDVEVFEYKNWTIGWIVRGNKPIESRREQKLDELCKFYQNGSIPLSHPSCQYVFERMKEKQEAP